MEQWRGLRRTRFDRLQKRIRRDRTSRHALPQVEVGASRDMLLDEIQLYAVWAAAGSDLLFTPGHLAGNPIFKSYFADCTLTVNFKGVAIHTRLTWLHNRQTSIKL